MSEHSSPDGSNYRSGVDVADRPVPNYEELEAAHFAALDRSSAEDAELSTELDELNADELPQEDAESGDEESEEAQEANEGDTEDAEDSEQGYDEDEDDVIPIPRPARPIRRPLPPREFEFGSEDDGERTAEELFAREVLSRHQRLHMTIKKGVASSLGVAERGFAYAMNTVTSPKLAWFAVRDNAYARIDRRVAGLQGKFDNKVVNWAVDKAAGIAYNKYENSNKVVDRVREERASRHDRVDRKQAGRTEKIGNNIGRLIEGKVAAVERKLIREEQRRRRLELRGERGIRSSERERLIKTLSYEDKKRIRSVAVTTVENRR